jgi:ABC-type Na+ transport system ATPase subunit NatA
MSKTQGNFKLTVVEGEFTDSQIVVMLGENGTGKTTFIRMLVITPLLPYFSGISCPKVLVTLGLDGVLT